MLIAFQIVEYFFKHFFYTLKFVFTRWRSKLKHVRFGIDTVSKMSFNRKIYDRIQGQLANGGSWIVSIDELVYPCIGIFHI